MNFYELSKKRRCVRSFIDKPVSKGSIEKIIESARLSPTARNIQPWEFIVITDKNIIKKISELAPNGQFVVGAAVCIAIFCKDTKYYLEDGCAATTNTLNAAADLGIGSCWIAGDKKPYCGEIAQMLSVPAEHKLISLIALGYSDEAPQPHDKRSLKSVIHWEKF